MVKNVIKCIKFIISLLCGILYFALAIWLYNGSRDILDLYLQAFVYYFPIFLLIFIVLLIALRLNIDEKSLEFWIDKKLMIGIVFFALILLFPFMWEINNDIFLILLFPMSISISLLVYFRIYFSK